MDPCCPALCDFQNSWESRIGLSVDFEHKVMLFHLSFGMNLTKESVGVPAGSPGHLVSACSNDLQLAFSSTGKHMNDQLIIDHHREMV